MANLGSLSKGKTSERKKKSSRENGKLGGRPISSGRHPAGRLKYFSTAKTRAGRQRLYPVKPRATVQTFDTPGEFCKARTRPSGESGEAAPWKFDVTRESDLGGN